MFAYNDKIIIEREGMGAKTSFPFSKPIEIEMSNIDSVQISEGGEGYVKIITKDNNGLSRAFGNIETDKYAIIISDNDGIRKIKDYINSRIGR